MPETETPVSVELRSPSIKNLGFKYKHGLMNVLLMDLKPGYERRTIKEIDKELQLYREGLWIANHEHEVKGKTKFRSDLNNQNDDYEGLIKDLTKKTSKDLESHAVHASLMGHFDLASLFISNGFSLCQRLNTLDRVLSYQVIIGGIPVPEKMDGLSVLCQENPNKFISPYQHEKDEDSYPELDEETFKKPILSISHLQVNGLLKTIIGGAAVVPVLLAIDSKIKSIVHKNEVTALVLDGLGWSDYTLLLKGSNLDLISKCIRAVTTITMADIEKAMEKLRDNSKHPDGSVNKESEEFKEMVEMIAALRGRYKRLLLYCYPYEMDTDPEGTTNKAWDNHFFTTLNTYCGILWPAAHFALQFSRAAYWDKEGDANEQKYNKGIVFDDAKAFLRLPIEGDARMKVFITHKAGHDDQVDEILKEISPCYERDVLTFGRTDKMIQDCELCQGLYDTLTVDKRKELDMTEDTNLCIKRMYPLRYLFAQEQFVRWKLLSEPLSDADGLGRRMPWHGQPNLGNRERLLRNMFAMLGGHAAFDSDSASCEKPGEGLSLTDYLERLIYESKSPNTFGDDLRSNYDRFKSVGVSRHLKEVFRDAIQKWRQEMAIPQESGNMFEISSPYLTWMNSLMFALDNNFDTSKVEALLRFMTQPFGAALSQKALTGYRMSEHTDLMMEFKGGLYKIITGIDGLLKSVLALIGPSLNVGGLTLVKHDPNLSIRIAKIHIGNNRYQLSVVAKLDYLHLVHPTTFHMVLHEMLHVVIQSADFLQCVVQSNLEGNLASILDNAISTDNSEGFYGERITEIAVEYLLGWLLFRDEPDYFTKTFFLQLAQNTESYANRDDENRKVLTEHISRCFFISYLLTNCEKRKDLFWNYSHVSKVFTEWWQRNAHFLLNPLPSKYGEERETGRDKYEEVIRDRVLERWCRDERFTQHLESIKKAVNRYFSGDWVDGKIDERSAELRKEFRKCLHLTISDSHEVEELLSDGKFTPVHFIFHNSKQQEECVQKNERPLRNRRLESLIGYLVLIRSFFRVTIGELETKTDGQKEDVKNIFLHLERDGVDIDFERTARHGFLVDRISGTLFTVTDKPHRIYVARRQAFLKSMWHLGEIMKHSNIITFVELKQALLDDKAGPNNIFMLTHSVDTSEKKYAELL